jgi:protein gp37
MHPAWVQSLLEHSQASEACFFFKQWGEWRAYGAIGALHDAHPDWRGDGTALPLQEWFGAHFVRVGRRQAGRHFLGREWNEVPLPLDIVVASSAS